MEDYKSKVVSAQEAIKAIKSGDTVVLSHAAGAPQLTIKALCENYKNYQDVKIYHMLVLGEAPYCAPEMKGHFKHITNFVGGNTRQAIAEGRADFFPMFFYQVPRALREGTIPVDAGSPQAQRIMIQRQGDIEGKKQLAREIAKVDVSLDQKPAGK